MSRELELYEKGYRKAVVAAARVLRATDWDPRTRKRLSAFVRLMASFARGSDLNESALRELGQFPALSDPRAAPPPAPPDATGEGK